MKVDLRKQFPVPAASKFGAPENDTSESHREALSWIGKRRKEDPSPVPWRMTYADRFDPKMHVHWIWVAGMTTGVPLVEPVVKRRVGIVRRRGRQLTPAAEEFHRMIVKVKGKGKGGDAANSDGARKG